MVDLWYYGAGDRNVRRFVFNFLNPRKVKVWRRLFVGCGGEDRGFAGVSCKSDDVRVPVNVESRVLGKVEAEDNLVGSWK